MIWPPMPDIVYFTCSGGAGNRRLEHRQLRCNMMNDLVSEESVERQGAPGAGAVLRLGFSRLLVGLGIRRPSFAERVEEYRRGTPAEQRARQQALRCVEGIEEARTRLLVLARGMSEGGIKTSVKFWPVTYRVGTDNKDRKFGVAEMQAAIVVATRTATGRDTTALPVTITATRRQVNILPNFAVLQTSEQHSYVTGLFLNVANTMKGAGDRSFCDRLEDALAEAVASGRLQG